MIVVQVCSQHFADFLSTILKLVNLSWVEETVFQELGEQLKSENSQSRRETQNIHKQVNVDLQLQQ